MVNNCAYTLNGGCNLGAVLNPNQTVTLTFSHLGDRVTLTMPRAVALQLAAHINQAANPAPVQPAAAPVGAGVQRGKKVTPVSWH